MSPEDTWILTEFVVAIPHDNPLTPCHTVVAPRRHVAAFYDLVVQEQRMMWDVIGEIRKRVTSSLKVEGFDIGFADASPDDKDPVHAHIHVVPRTPGAPIDLPSGIEWVYLGSN
jgi:diadenosine tetraphosphate (Ap4A) HIT family hydrolase